MAEEKDVICPACNKRMKGATQLDNPIRRPAERCQHMVRTYYPGFTVAWCPSCALAYNECALCGEKML